MKTILQLGLLLLAVMIFFIGLISVFGDSKVSLLICSTVTIVAGIYWAKRHIDLTD